MANDDRTLWEKLQETLKRLADESQEGLLQDKDPSIGFPPVKLQKEHTWIKDKDKPLKIYLSPEPNFIDTQIYFDNTDPREELHLTSWMNKPEYENIEIIKHDEGSFWGDRFLSAKRQDAFEGLSAFDLVNLERGSQGAHYFTLANGDVAVVEGPQETGILGDLYARQILKRVGLQVDNTGRYDDRFKSPKDMLSLTQRATVEELRQDSPFRNLRATLYSNITGDGSDQSHETHTIGGLEYGTLPVEFVDIPKSKGDSVNVVYIRDKALTNLRENFSD